MSVMVVVKRSVLVIIFPAVSRVDDASHTELLLAEGTSESAYSAVSTKHPRHPATWAGELLI